MKIGPVSYGFAEERRIAGGERDAPPLLTPDTALFHDVDGSLIELAETPDSIVVADDLPELLSALHHALGGALAIVSGRRLEDIDRLLSPLMLPGAGVHGAEWRQRPNGEIQRSAARPLRGVYDALCRSFANDPRILIENKELSVAIHYRLAPERMAECHAVAADISLTSELTMNIGKMVVEILPPGPNKGRATQALMRHAPFANRVPVFVGDDETDEDGIALVQELGGFGVKVGEGPSAAEYRLADVAAVHRWLYASLESLGR